MLHEVHYCTCEHKYCVHQLQNSRVTTPFKFSCRNEGIYLMHAHGHTFKVCEECKKYWIKFKQQQGRIHGAGAI